MKRFLEAFWAKDKPGGHEIMCLMNLAMAASYDPDPAAPNGFRLPFDLETGELLPARWKRWLAHDPIHMVKKYRANLKTLRGMFIDCGWRDQYHIHYGTRLLSRELAGTASTTCTRSSTTPTPVSTTAWTAAWVS